MINQEMMTTDVKTSPEEIEAQILAFGELVEQRMDGRSPRLFHRNRLIGWLLDRAMEDQALRNNLFRLVDVLPMLQKSSEVSRHLTEYLNGKSARLPLPIRLAIRTGAGPAAPLASRVLQDQVRSMGRRFIIGENIKEALPALRRLHQLGIASAVDLLGEATLSEMEAQAYQARCLDLIAHLARESHEWPADEVIDQDHHGPIPRANVSLKVSAFAPQLDPADLEGSVSRLKERVLPVVLEAKRQNVFINFDMEQWELHEITLALFEEICAHLELRSWPHLGIAIQGYLRESPKDLERVLSIARARGERLTVRLIKGAYLEFEIAHARQYGYPCPVFLEKAQTDLNYEKLSLFLLENHKYLYPAFGSHNLRSLSHALVQVREMGLPQTACEIQMLHGMAEAECVALRSLGYRVRVYCPVGELIPGMAYLVRRLLENTSNSGFLRLSQHEGKKMSQLLQRPQPSSREGMTLPGRNEGLGQKFENCPHTDFTRAENRAAMQEAIDQLQARLPINVPVVIGGERPETTKKIERRCPSETSRIVARVNCPSPEDAEQAIQFALKAWPAWRDRPVEERALFLEKLADRMEADRFELAAVETLETGKPWREADADVAEAVDFCRYYARQAIEELSPRKMGNVPGEENWLNYEGRGPTVIIAPWNFPLAIWCGMTVAALVAGNPVLIKPAEQSSAVAWVLFQRLMGIGIPPHVAQFLPGIGEEVGRFLVEHPLVAQIAFTGSKKVGLSIIESAGIMKPGQPHIKRVICEMGGKNAIIIDEDADLDEAIMGVMQSAFGYAGQKCSACSRLILVGDIGKEFLPRFIETCRSLTIAPAHSPTCRLGPVIDEEAYARLNKVIQHPGEGAKPLYIGEAPQGGWFIAPALFEVNGPNHPLMQEELFGPIFAVLRVEDFDEALRAANMSEYALTGGVYSRLPSHLERARREFRVGNLYLNRPCTGAMVGRQPFGGFGMSGMGVKAGGPGYVAQFCQTRCVTENTMRHGFSPDFAT